ncbi:Os03g0748750, partial [Oryza sativa Japonica Group]
NQLLFFPRKPIFVLLSPFQNLSHFSIFYIYIYIYIYMSRFINININMKNARMTYIVKRSES